MQWFVVVLMVGRCCYGCFGCDGAGAALAAALLLAAVRAAELAGVTGLALAGCTLVLVLVHSLGSDVGRAKRNCSWRSWCFILDVDNCLSRNDDKNGGSYTS